MLSEQEMNERLLGITKEVQVEERQRLREYLTPISLDDFEALALEPPNWLIDHVVPKAGLIALSGKFGSYKTFFAIWMGLRIAQGLPLFDVPQDKTAEECNYLHKNHTGHTGPQGVLIVEEENSDGLIQERTKYFKKPKGIPFVLLPNKGFKLTKPDYLDILAERCFLDNIKLVILDPFSSVLGAESENDNAEISGIMDKMRHGLVDKGVSVMFLHHPAKSGMHQDAGNNLRGAGDILGKCDVHLCLTVPKKRDSLIKVTYEKLRIANMREVEDFEMRFIEANILEGAYFRYEREARDEREVKEEEDVAKLLSLFTKGQEATRKEIAEGFGLSSSHRVFISVWDKALAEGFIKQNITSKQFYLAGTD